MCSCSSVVKVPDQLLLELANLVGDEQLEWRLRNALAREVRVLALEIDEREMMIRALEDPPAGLEEPRAVLLREHVARVRGDGP